MKNKLLLFSATFFAFVNLNFGQLAAGSIAPNFTLTDIAGNQQDLYTYLNAGKTVYIDFFACHCPYCWAYHNTHALSDLYDQHGPGTSSDDVFVLAIELDPNNGINEFQGVSGVTQGNWLAGTNYPHINPEGSDLSTIVSAFAVNFYPMIYAICPDKTITLLGQQTTSNLYNHTFTCSTNTLNTPSETAENVEFYLNPDNTLEIIGKDLTNSEIRVYNVLGEKVFDEKGDQSLDFSKCKGGMYFVSFLQNQTKITRKIVVP